MTPISEAAVEALTFTYRNWRGEVSERRVMPDHVFFGQTRWHREPQWLLVAHDLDKNETRAFAMRDMTFAAPPPPPDAAVEAAVLGERAACVAIAEGMIEEDGNMVWPDSEEIAALIRARSAAPQTKSDQS